MVRPNQIISSDIDKGELTFIMFAMSEPQIKRRVVALNFPGFYLRSTLKGDTPTDIVKDVRVVSSGMVNRYAVTIDTTKMAGK